MASPYVPIDSWTDLPTTIDEQAEILRGALRIGDAPARQLDHQISLERWEAEFLLREARRPGPVSRAAVLLLQVRAAEWASQRALRQGATGEAFAELARWALEQVHEMRDGLAALPHEVAALESRLGRLRNALGRSVPAPVSSSGSGSSSVTDAIGAETSVMDRTTVLDAVGIDPSGPPPWEDPLDEAIDLVATSVLDRDAVMSAIAVADAARATGAAAAAEVTTMAAIAPIAPTDLAVGAETSVLDRDEVFRAIGVSDTSGEIFAAADGDDSPLDATFIVDSIEHLDPAIALEATDADDVETMMLDRDEVLAAVAELEAAQVEAPAPFEESSVEESPAEVGAAFELIDALDTSDAIDLLDDRGDVSSESAWSDLEAEDSSLADVLVSDLASPSAPIAVDALADVARDVPREEQSDALEPAPEPVAMVDPVAVEVETESGRLAYVAIAAGVLAVIGATLVALL